MMVTSSEPFVCAETPAYLLVYKPPGLPTAPLTATEEHTLVQWCVKRFPEVGNIKGRKLIEGGLLHRLDTDTNGLVLFARTQEAYDLISAQQEGGLFLKTYRAWCIKREEGGHAAGPGCPPLPFQIDWSCKAPFLVESAFRAYGPGRKAVRPVVVVKKTKEISLDHGKPYRTKILSIQSEPQHESLLVVNAQIARGFRHQIRCHLAWIGMPILGDKLYNPHGTFKEHEKDLLHLQAWAVEFRDPETGESVRYELSSSTETGGMV
ncbi:MAG: RNA pseudouridine synthase [Treponema sp.]|nr:RNA pseudouridine synthase [Treponema sp.]